MSIKAFVAIFLISLCVATANAQERVQYTGLASKNCRTIHSNPDEGGSYLGECPGVRGYKLQLTEGDLRQSINIIEPSRRKTDLNLWNISGGFSSLGETAEWRLRGNKPYALILRFNVSENAEEPSRNTSYLVVVRLDGKTPCITDALQPTRSHNYEARRAADRPGPPKCRY